MYRDAEQVRTAASYFARTKASRMLPADEVAIYPCRDVGSLLLQPDLGWAETTPQKPGSLGLMVRLGIRVPGARSLSGGGIPC